MSQIRTVPVAAGHRRGGAVRGPLGLDPRGSIPGARSRQGRRELGQSAQVIANHFQGVTGDQWQRTGNRSDGASFTVETFARYFIHDPLHHLYDVTGLRVNGNS